VVRDSDNARRLSWAALLKAALNTQDSSHRNDCASSWKIKGRKIISVVETVVRTRDAVRVPNLGRAAPWVKADAMKTLSVAGDRVVILLSGEDTQQQYAVMEATVPPGAGPPPHLHHKEDETFLVLSGEITFFLDGKPYPLKQGEFIFAPRGVPHYFKNTGSADAVLLETASPAGVERFFEVAGHPLSARTDRPLPITAEDVARLRKMAPEFGIEIFPPN
jgi:quercetin dioxygenase-like cupin family protein